MPDPPRIYAASLSDYNAGILHGRWIDADTDPAAMQQQIDVMLAESPTTRATGEPAEGWAIHDYENFGPLELDEHDPLEAIALVAAGFEAHGTAFLAFADVVEIQYVDVDRFEDRYEGHWEDVEDYAAYMLAELDADRYINEAPAWLQPYLTLDTQGFARDLELGGDVNAVSDPAGGIWVFSQ